MSRHPPIPVIDLFAGPGGLSEGFGAFAAAGHKPFSIMLSIEKDAVACETLRLRKFLALFDSIPDEYTALTRGELGMDDLYNTYPSQAKLARERTWQCELGVEPNPAVSRRVRNALGDNPAPWVLIGGPPCQAYSLVGRSRMRSTKADFDNDKRHFLYREYLQIVARHQPTVFVMENVRGILSSKTGGTGIFRQIIRDLRRPSFALDFAENRRLEYRLYGLAPGAEGEFRDDDDPSAHFLVRAEDHGIPQARHRVFIVGVRSDFSGMPAPLETSATKVTISDVISDLPVLRSRLSRSTDSWDAWISALRKIRESEWMRAPMGSVLQETVAVINRVVSAQAKPLSYGSSYSEHRRTTVAARSLSEWYRSGTAGLTLHETRSHMVSDLHRYLFAASFSSVTGRSPGLRDFPVELRPAHENVGIALEHGLFSDRFRVQCGDRPSSTVTSHISKDGHYFIHYDPQQCRSLTVREAARLQTFPDSYFFCGNRTQQFHQVGNAVPPLLAKQVAARIYGLLARR